MSLYQSNSTCKVLEFYKEILSGHSCVFPRGSDVSGSSTVCANMIMVRKRALSLRTGKGNCSVDAAINKN